MNICLRGSPVFLCFMSSEKLEWLVQLRTACSTEDKTMDKTKGGFIDLLHLKSKNILFVAVFIAMRGGRGSQLRECLILFRLDCIVTIFDLN